jgi:hypothetical protein
MTTSSIVSCTSRSLHLVDLENLAGNCGTGGATEIRSRFAEYLDLARWRTGDHVIVAANPSIIRRIGFDPLVPCNLHAVKGRDAADVMLLSFAAPELVARRYGRLVVGSGDGIFAARSRAVRKLGVDVEVVARRGSCSRRLLDSFRCSFVMSPLPDVVLAA